MTTENQTAATTPRLPTYRCSNRSCTAEAPDTGAIPTGWLGLRRYPGDREVKPTNLGVYCSLPCVIESAGLMQARLLHPSGDAA